MFVFADWDVFLYYFASNAAFDWLKTGLSHRNIVVLKIVQLGFFDPLGLLTDGNEETFNDLREKELKHGRVSMLAVTGYLVTAAGVRFPGAEDIPDGLSAFGALLESKDGMNVLG